MNYLFRYYLHPFKPKNKYLIFIQNFERVISPLYPYPGVASFLKNPLQWLKSLIAQTFQPVEMPLYPYPGVASFLKNPLQWLKSLTAQTFQPVETALYPYPGVASFLKILKMECYKL